MEEAWLHDTGLSTLVSGTLTDSQPAEALLSTLTRSQAAMVKKRLDNYSQTLRMRNRQSIRHVRDVFATTDTSVSTVCLTECKYEKTLSSICCWIV